MDIKRAPKALRGVYVAIWLLFVGLVLILTTPVRSMVLNWIQDDDSEFNYGKKNNVSVGGDSFTLDSGIISNQLGGVQINDVYAYDTTQDSNTATLISLGIDPNWRNGVVKYYGTLAEDDSENIQVGVPDNDYTNGNIIDLRITTSGTTGTAVYEWRERTTTDYTTMSFDGTDTLTKTGAFTNSRVGDQVLITGGTGITRGFIAITTVTNNDTVIIDTDIGGNVSDVTTTVITGSWTQNYTTATTLLELGSIGVTVSFTSGASFTQGDIYQINSWFTEQLDATELGSCNITTMDRCGTREFPKKSFLIAINSNVYIFDAKDNALWMKFDEGGGGLPNITILGHSNESTKSLFGLNSQIYFGRLAEITIGGTVRVNFSTEKSKLFLTSGYDRKANISQRNSSASNVWSYNANQPIINNSVNDVHVAVINDKTYVAVATDGGVSVINETDGIVTDIDVQPGYEYYDVFLQSNGNLYTHMAWSPNYDYSRMYVWYSIPSSDESYLNADFAYRWDNALFNIGGNTVGSLFRLNKYDVILGDSIIDGSSNVLYIGTTNNGFSLLQEKQGDETNGSVKYFTKDYITEEMIGDIRGMWTFDQAGIGNGDTTIANAEDVQDRSVRDTDLMVVDGGGTAPQLVDGVRGKAIQFDGSNDYLTQKVYEDETGASFGSTYHGLSLANNQAFYRVEGVDLSPYKGNDSSSTPYMLVLKDSADKTAWGYIGDQDAAEAVGSELVTSNAGFETYTGTQDDGTSDAFNNWVNVNVDDGVGSKIEATATAHDGSDAVKLTMGSSGSRPYIRTPVISVTSGKLYKLSFYTRGDGVNGGGYMMRDTTNDVTFIQEETGITGTSYQEFIAYFSAPAGCANVYPMLRAPNDSGGTAYFDDVSITEVTDIGIDGVHILSTRNGSTRNWAGIESGFNYNDSSYTFKVRKSDFQTDGVLTFGAWVKMANTGWQHILEKSSDLGAEYPTFWMRYENTQAKYQVRLRTTTALRTVLSTTTPQTGTWYFVVGTMDTSQTKLFVNGLEEDSTAGGIPYNSYYPIEIGRKTSQNTGHFNGSIDEPFITAEALTATDILRMWRTGCRAMGGTPNEPGGGSPNTCDDIPAEHPTNTLAGSQDAVYGVTIDNDSNYTYVATSGSGTGAVSKIDLSSDTLVESWTTGSSLALPSNNIDGGISLDSIGDVISLGTDSGFSILSPTYTGIGSLISGTASGVGNGYDTGPTGGTVPSSFTAETNEIGVIQFLLRGGDDEAMSQGLTPWYDVTVGNLSSGLNEKRYYQWEAVLEPDSNGDIPEVSSVSIEFENLPASPSNLTYTSRTKTTITWSYTDNSNNEDEFLIKDEAGNIYCETNAAGITECEENGLIPNTNYTRVVSSINGVGESGDSVPASAWTLAETPGINGEGFGPTSVRIMVKPKSNSSATEYALYESTAGKYVQTDGTLGSSTVWQKYSKWEGSSGTEVRGLEINTPYKFKIKGRNGEGIETNYSKRITVWTGVQTPGIWDVVVIGWTSLRVVIDPGENPEEVEYAIFEASGGKYVQVNGTLDEPEVWQTYDVWGGDEGILVTGLIAAKEYNFQVKARNGNGKETELSSIVGEYPYGEIINPGEKNCTYYIVQKGDNLYSIAESELGDGNMYTMLVGLNKGYYPSLETNIGYIDVGWKLLIGCKEVEESKPKEEEKEESKDEEKEEEEKEDTGLPETGEKEGYFLRVKVIDEKGGAVKGAKVTLYSEPREKVTDEKGIVEYEGVERGEHRLLVATGNKSGEQKIILNEDKDVYEVVVRLQENRKMLSILLLLCIFLILVVVFLLVDRIKRKDDNLGVISSKGEKS